MRRHLASAAVATLFLAAPAAADPGAPGSTFPEQPGTPAGCAAVLTNPGTEIGGVAGTHHSAQADAITLGLVRDACFGG